MINVKQLVKNCPNWSNYINHPFVKNLAEEKLTKVNFQNYLIQDFIFLFNYGKIFSLLSTKASSISDFVFAINEIKIIESKINNLYNKNYKKINLQEIIVDNECQLYIGYLYQLANNSTYFELLIALLPGVIGYYKIGQNLNILLENNPDHKYKKWIKIYNNKKFQNNVKKMINFVNKFHEPLNLEQINKLQEIFNYSTNLEINFFNLGLKK